jgi:Predicted transcriptional regulators
MVLMNSPVVDKRPSGVSHHRHFRQARKARGLTLTALSARSGIAVSMISKAERGDIALTYDKAPEALPLPEVSCTSVVWLKDALQPSPTRRTSFGIGRMFARFAVVLLASWLRSVADTPTGYANRRLAPDVLCKKRTERLSPGADFG